MIVKQKLMNALEYAAGEAQKKGILIFTALPEIIIEHPQNAQHGDYASSLPLKLVKMAKLPPMTIAEKIIELLPSIPEVSLVTAAKPGFINFTLNPSWLSASVEDVLGAHDRFGAIDYGQGKTIQLEFVSGNPTGPLHVGHGRGAVLGSTLANVLQNAGYRVQKEYYINDAGSQLNAFYRTSMRVTGRRSA
jgi:arginyl-tRNA synthetase